MSEKTGKKKRSRRRKLLYWLLIDVAVLATVVGLLLYKPSRYDPVEPPPADPNGQRVHPYLHRDLGATFYNGAQDRRPFEVVVLDKNLNEAIAQMRLSRQSEGVTLSAPAVLFTPGRIVLMGTAAISGAELVVTIEVAPHMDEQGQLSLAVEKVKVGAMNITPLAKIVAQKMYRDYLDMGMVDTEELGAKVVAALLNNEPFDPIVEVDNRRVRLQSFDISEGRLIAQFAPAK